MTPVEKHHDQAAENIEEALTQIDQLFPHATSFQNKQLNIAIGQLYTAQQAIHDVATLIHHIALKSQVRAQNKIK